MRNILPFILLAACSGDRQNATTQSTQSPGLAHASQLDLAHELDDAEARGTWSEVKRRWTGQVLRWTVTRQRVLCETEARCNVAAFPVQRSAQYGWLPELSFASGQFAALQSMCGTAATCEVSIEGTLEKIEVSPELPTNLRFTNVRVVTQTASR